MKPSIFATNGASVLLILIAGIILFEVSSTYAAPHQPSYPGYYSSGNLEGQNPEYLLQTIARLRQALIADDDLENLDEAYKMKRIAADFGTARGYSGNLESAGRLRKYYADMIGRKKRNPSLSQSTTDELH